MAQRFSAWQRLLARLGWALDRVLIDDAWRAASTVGSDQGAAMRRALEVIQRQPSTLERVKGAPDLVNLRRTVATRLMEASFQSLQSDSELLGDARLLAGLKVEDPYGFLVHQQVFEWQNEEVLSALRSNLKARVVLHMTCVPRLDRARASEGSFDSKGLELEHLHVIGGGFGTSYRLDGRVLSVPVPDSYEHLPQKMAAAFALLAHVTSLEGVLKVDDDHRLGEPSALEGAWVRMSGAPQGQGGMIIRARHHGDHERAWHFGKCSDGALNGRPHQWFAALRWCDGAAGYFVSRSGLRAVHWASLYFGDFVGSALYEDVLMSEIMRRFSAGLRQIDMTRVLSTRSDY